MNQALAHELARAGALRLFSDLDRRMGQSVMLSAIDYARTGGMGLHVWNPQHWSGFAPNVFRNAAKRGKPWAHLFDQDVERLKTFARAVGVRAILVGRPGGEGQHIDLCGGPLDAALSLAAIIAKSDEPERAG